MRKKIFRFLFVTSLGLLAACASTPDKISDTGNASLDRLNQGYSMLYQGVDGLRHTNKIFYLKRANEEVRGLVTRVAEEAAQLAQDLREIQQQDKSIRLDLDPLPEIEKIKLGVVQKQLLFSLAPIVGETGTDFERTLLLILAGGVNQMRYLAQVMVDEEKNIKRQDVLEQAAEEFFTLYKDVLKLLNEKYYTHNTFNPNEFD